MTAYPPRLLSQLIAVSLALACGSAAKSSPHGGAPTGGVQEQAEEIQLENRRFVPEPGVESSLKEKLREAKHPVFGIVQLVQKPSPEDRALLSEMGIELQQFLGGTTYHAKFQTSARLDEAIPPIRWAGPLLPEDKLERALWESRVEDWARAKGGAVKVLIYLHAHVGKDEAREIIGSFAEDYREHEPSNAWAAIVPLEDIRTLASDDRVRRIEQGPKPFMPLS